MKKELKNEESEESEDSEDSQTILYCYLCGLFYIEDKKNLGHFANKKHIKKICEFINQKDETQSIKEFCVSYLKTKKGMMEMHELFRHRFPIFNSIDYCFNSYLRQQIYMSIEKYIDNHMVCALIAANITKMNSRAAICGLIQNNFE